MGFIVLAMSFVGQVSCSMFIELTFKYSVQKLKKKFENGSKKFKGFF